MVPLIRTLPNLASAPMALSSHVSAGLTVVVDVVGADVGGATVVVVVECFLVDLCVAAVAGTVATPRINAAPQRATTGRTERRVRSLGTA